MASIADIASAILILNHLNQDCGLNGTIVLSTGSPDKRQKDDAVTLINSVSDDDIGLATRLIKFDLDKIGERSRFNKKFFTASKSAQTPIHARAKALEQVFMKPLQQILED